jgi:hypothetical protein
MFKGMRDPAHSRDNQSVGGGPDSRSSKGFNAMTEVIATAVRAKTAKPGASLNLTLNYALGGVAVIGALAIFLALMIW